MPCDRKSAIRQLLNLHIERVTADSDYALRTTVADVVTEENVENVSKLGLHAEYDYPPVALRDCERDIRLLQAWLSSPMGRHSMTTALEIALMLAGLLALGWAIISPRAGIAARLIAITLGLAALIAARAHEREHREDRQ
jgi:hypothetical protein